MELDIFELLKENPKIRIKLKQDFINFVRSKILEKFKSIKDFYKSVDICSYDSLINWLKPNKNHQTNPLLKDFIELIKRLDIKEKLLFDNVSGFSLWGSPRITYLPYKINLTEDLITCIGLYVGDGLTSKIGMSSKNRVTFTNSELRLVTFFGKIMLEKCLMTPKQEIFLYVYSREPEKIDIEFLQKKFSIKLSQIKTYFGEQKRPNYKFGAGNSIRRIVLDILILKIKKLCLENKNFAKAYLKGIFLAEGNIYFNPEKYQRFVAIELADKEEIEYIKNLLKIFGIKRKSYKNVRGYYVINIGYRKGLETLRDLKFFNLVKERQKLLEDMCKSYKARKSRWWK